MNIEHTHNLDRWGYVYGRRAVLLERPKPTKRKEKYREPKVKEKWCKDKATAELTVMQWKGKLI